MTFRGKKTGETVTEYSDALAILLAKHHGIGREQASQAQPALDVSPEQLAILRQLADYAASRKAQPTVSQVIPPSADGQSATGASQDAPR